MRVPREDDDFSLDLSKRGGGGPPPPLPPSIPAMEMGIPRGKDTTTGSLSGSLGATSTLMGIIVAAARPSLAGVDDGRRLSTVEEDDEDAIALSDLRFLLGLPPEDAIVVSKRGEKWDDHALC